MKTFNLTSLLVNAQTDEEKWAIVRYVVEATMEATEWTQINGILRNAKRAEFSTYRRALRDVVTTGVFPGNFTLPAMPTVQLVDYASVAEAGVQSGAEAQAAAIPNWATWTEAEVLSWLQTNILTPIGPSDGSGIPSPITSFAQVRAVLVIMVGIMSKQYLAQEATSRMVVALRNKAFPGLEGS